MKNRPSLADTIIVAGPYKSGEWHPLGRITTNQLNELRDYILELEEKVENAHKDD